MSWVFSDRRGAGRHTRWRVCSPKPTESFRLRQNRSYYPDLSQCTGLIHRNIPCNVDDGFLLYWLGPEGLFLIHIFTSLQTQTRRMKSLKLLIALTAFTSLLDARAA